MSKVKKEPKLKTLLNIWRDTEKKDEKNSNTDIKRNALPKTTTGKK